VPFILVTENELISVAMMPLCSDMLLLSRLVCPSRAGGGNEIGGGFGGGAAVRGGRAEAGCGQLNIINYFFVILAPERKTEVPGGTLGFSARLGPAVVTRGAALVAAAPATAALAGVAAGARALGPLPRPAPARAAVAAAPSVAIAGVRAVAAAPRGR